MLVYVDDHAQWGSIGGDTTLEELRYDVATPHPILMLGTRAVDAERLAFWGLHCRQDLAAGALPLLREDVAVVPPGGNAKGRQAGSRREMRACQRFVRMWKICTICNENGGGGLTAMLALSRSSHGPCV